MVGRVGGVGANYREKYLSALDEQERMEKQFSVQMDFLRKTLIHLSAAVQGLDKQLDASLIVLKDKMRGASGPQVVAQMEKVHQAVGHFERNRDEERKIAARRLGAIIEQLLQLKIPTNVKKNLTSFNSGIVERFSSYRNYPEVLKELAKLQQLALTAAANPPTTLWQRLKGGRTLASSAQEKGQADKTKPQQDQRSESEAGYNSLTVIEDVQNSGDFDNEDGYDRVADRIALTLRELLDKIEPNDVVRHKVEVVSARIERGMDWYVLAVTLEDIRDILMQRYLEGDREFSNYLKRVNDELSSISAALGLAVESDSEKNKAAEEFSSAVSEQMASMRSKMKASGSLDHLKEAVTDHLTSIQKALSNYQQNKNSGSSLTDQLQALVSRVQSIESESQKTKELLEEERYKATHDVLTSLPNREAYNERAFDELQRFERYNRPLTMAVCDIDHFKRVNDDYGHQAGDKVLALIAKIISNRLRQVDFVARYGGEEFVILMPETELATAFDVLDKIREAIAKTPVRFKDNPVQITISFGLAGFDQKDSVESVFERADKALYEAKNQGRNCCVMEERAP